MGAFILALLGSSLTAQQVTYGDTIVEVVGLRHWSVERLEAGVQRYRPGVTLASSACAVILRDSIGFADAAVSVSTLRGSDTVWVLLSVVEPEDSSLIRYDTESRSPIPIPDMWSELHHVLVSNRGALSPLQHVEVLLDGAGETLFGRVPEATLDIRRKIREHSTSADRDLAYELLEGSSDPMARQLAALVASNFPDEDRTWHLLIQGIIAGSDVGSIAATMIFGTLARSGRFSVNWAGGKEALTAAMGGTNLFAYRGLLTGLVETDVDAKLALELVRQNPHLLVDHALAENRMASMPARLFLQHLGAPDPARGRDTLIDWIRRQGSSD